jgi:hypothetical protein
VPDTESSKSLRPSCTSFRSHSRTILLDKRFQFTRDINPRRQPRRSQAPERTQGVGRGCHRTRVFQQRSRAASPRFAADGRLSGRAVVPSLNSRYTTRWTAGSRAERSAGTVTSKSRFSPIEMGARQNILIVNDINRKGITFCLALRATWQQAISTGCGRCRPVRATWAWHGPLPCPTLRPEPSAPASDRPPVREAGGAMPFRHCHSGH